MGKSTCIKCCGKGVNLLVCMNSKCPVAVHERCMPSSLQVQDREKFCCPYCLYKQSVAECSQSKDKALLARTNLSLFLGAKLPVNKEHESNITTDKWSNHEEIGDEDRVTKNEQGFHLQLAEKDPKFGGCSLVHVRGMYSNEQASLSTAAKKGGYLRSCKGSRKVSRCSDGLKPVEDQKSFDSRLEGGVLTVDSVDACKERTNSVEYPLTTPMPLAVVGGEMVQFHQNYTENQQHPQPFDYCNMEKGMELELSVHNFGERSRVGKVGMLKRKNKWHRDAGPFETAIYPISDGNSAKIYEESNRMTETCTSFKYHDRAEVYVWLARKVIQSAIEPKNYTLPGEVSDQSFGNEDYGCNDRNTVMASNAGWVDKPSKKICCFNVASDARPKRLMWTTEEEEMLKKGVLVFSSGVKKNLPWRKILAFGSHVFARSRTPLDLQSKWKFMSKKQHLTSNEEPLKSNSKREAAVTSDEFWET